MNQITYILPAYWASYLINGDASGSSESEQREADNFLKANKLGVPVDCGESYFSWHNATNQLGGDVAEFTFLNY